MRISDWSSDVCSSDLEIDPVQALIVERIFREFAVGKSPHAIACDLNAEGIPGPAGKPWRDTSIRGDVRRGTGILNNELYVGVRVWNHKHSVKDPSTGKDVTRLNPESEWIRNAVPELRIVSDALWEAVKRQQQMLAERYASVKQAEQRSEEHTSELQSLMRISYAVS